MRGVLYVIVLAVAGFPLIARGAFLTTTLDGNSFESHRGTDPAGATTFVGDRLSAVALGNNLPVPIGESVAVDVRLPAGKFIRVAPGSNFTIELWLGATDISGAGFAIISSFTGSVVVDVNGGEETRTLPFFNEAIVSDQTTAFRMVSQGFTPAAGGEASLIDGLSFTFNIGPVGLLNDPPLLADELRLMVRGSTFVPNDQVATLPPQVTLVPEPSALALAALGASALLRRRGRVDARIG